MLLRRTKLQLVAFAVISVVAIVYALIRFAVTGHRSAVECRRSGRGVWRTRSTSGS